MITVMPKTATQITASETCRIIGISRSTLTYWMLTGKIAPAGQIGSPGQSRPLAHLFDRADVERLAAERAR